MLAALVLDSPDIGLEGVDGGARLLILVTYFWSCHLRTEGGSGEVSNSKGSGSKQDHLGFQAHLSFSLLIL